MTTSPILAQLLRLIKPMADRRLRVPVPRIVAGHRLAH